ncbi:MAG: hypothetical protein CW336_00940 [Bacteroidetes bacterium]|nr:hypothetical protein [Bacteroidota bacterium]
MKKYFLAIGLVAFLMTSCCEKQENNANCEKQCKDKKEQCDKHQHECDHHGDMPMPGMCPEMMACMDKIVESVANWENLNEAQRAEVIDMAKKMQEVKANMPKPECNKHEGKCGKHEGECKEHKGDCKEHKGECKHEEGKKCDGKKCEGKKCEGKKCEGNHEGCQHQHEGCDHNDR